MRLALTAHLAMECDCTVCGRAMGSIPEQELRAALGQAVRHEPPRDEVVCPCCLVPLLRAEAGAEFEVRAAAWRATRKEK